MLTSGFVESYFDAWNRHDPMRVADHLAKGGTYFDIPSQRKEAMSQVVELDASDIAQRCALLMPSLSRILQNLHRRRPVDRTPAAEDQRRSMISITPAGRALFDTLSPVNEARYAYITEKFGYGKLELLYELLEELVEKIDEDDVT